MIRTEMKAAAKEQIKGNIGKLFAISLVTFAILLACYIAYVGLFAVPIVFLPTFAISYCMIYLKIANKEEVKVGNVFDGFNCMGKAIWLDILIRFFTFLWSLLFIVPGIIKSYAYSQARYILADNQELTAREALKKSEEMMKGHKMEYFVLQLSFIGWDIVVAITLGIAGIYVIPYMNATYANFYNSIKEA